MKVSVRGNEVASDTVVDRKMTDRQAIDLSKLCARTHLQRALLRNVGLDGRALRVALGDRGTQLAQLFVAEHGRRRRGGCTAARTEKEV